jgi:hypothetical protein
MSTQSPSTQMLMPASPVLHSTSERQGTMHSPPSQVARLLFVRAMHSRSVSHPVSTHSPLSHEWNAGQSQSSSQPGSHWFSMQISVSKQSSSLLHSTHLPPTHAPPAQSTSDEQVVTQAFSSQDVVGHVQNESKLAQSAELPFAQACS